MIEVKNLTKRFPRGDDEIVAVDNLSFRVEPGEVYGLLGPNGAGKTTSLRMILGLLKPTTGDATIGGHSVADSPDEVKRRIGFASASFGVYPWLTPKETLQFVGDLYDLTPSFANEQIEKLTELMGLGPILNQYCATLSTGQKQRVNLARALIHNPPVMLLDEPTLGLDVVGSNVVFEYIGHLKQQKKAVIVCTHRLDEAQRLCDRFGLLHKGHLRYEGTIDEIRSQTGSDNLTDIFLDLLQSDPVTESAGEPLPIN